MFDEIVCLNRISARVWTSNTHPPKYYGDIIPSQKGGVLTSIFSVLTAVSFACSNDFYPNVTTLRSDLCYRKSVCRL